ERRLREPLFDGLLEQPGARGGCLRSGAVGPAAGDLLEHDPAAALAVALGKQLERLLDVGRLRLGRLAQVRERERLRRDDEQRLDRPSQLGGGSDLGRNQAERTVQERLLSASAREILIEANGEAWARSISFCFRSASS